MASIGVTIGMLYTAHYLAEKYGFYDKLGVILTGILHFGVNLMLSCWIFDCIHLIKQNSTTRFARWYYCAINIINSTTTKITIFLFINLNFCTHNILPR
jgi:hypothetical protein